jgi:DNA-directed RNA polymerase specialized sigma24 family protein
MTTATRSCTTAGATGNVGDLLARASDGDPAAWEEVVRRYDKLVLATVRSFRLQDADALDAVQTTWLRLAENAHRVLWPERLGGWLVTTACWHNRMWTTWFRCSTGRCSARRWPSGSRGLR